MPPVTPKSKEQKTLSTKKVVGEYKIGKQLKKNLLGKELGEGTFGHVKLGTHIPTGHKVAIKILEKDKILDQSDIERVSREIQILKLIRHPNIIQLYEIIEDDTHLYLITEFAVGGELFDYIVEKTRLRESEACRFFQQILSGVEYVHKLNIVHRDLKPENLLLDHKKSIKIVDFGLSNTYREASLLETACGSPCYAAPEMIAGKAYHGLRVDIWSCGVILYAMICGYLPFDDQDTQILYKKIMKCDYSIPSYVSPEARDLIQNILNTDPDTRYTLEDIRNHPWYRKHGEIYKSDGIVVGYHKIPVDEEILKEVMGFGFEKNMILKYLRNNKHNKMSTLYYLLLARKVEQGYDSEAHIANKKFKPEILSDRKGDKEIKAANEEMEKIKRDEEKRRQIEELKRFKVELDKKSKLKEDEKVKVKILHQEVIHRNHERIEKRTRRPNLKKLNNTTAMSIEERSLEFKLGMSKGSKSPERSQGKEKKNSRQKKKSRKRSIDGILEKRQRLKQRLLANKMKELKKGISSGKRAKNKSYNLQFGLVKSPQPKKRVKRKKKGKYSAESRKYSELISSGILKKSNHYRTKFNRKKSPLKEKSRENTAKKRKRKDKSKNKSKVIEYEMKTHKGPLNLSAVTMKDPYQVMKELKPVLSMLKVKTKQVSEFGINCELSDIRFLIEINYVENFKNFFTLKFYKNSGDSLEYAHLCKALFSQLEL